MVIVFSTIENPESQRFRDLIFFTCARSRQICSNLSQTASYDSFFRLKILFFSISFPQFQVDESDLCFTQPKTPRVLPHCINHVTGIKIMRISMREFGVQKSVLWGRFKPFSLFCLASSASPIRPFRIMFSARFILLLVASAVALGGAETKKVSNCTILRNSRSVHCVTRNT